MRSTLSTTATAIALALASPSGWSVRAQDAIYLDPGPGDDMGASPDAGPVIGSPDQPSPDQPSPMYRKHKKAAVAQDSHPGTPANRASDTMRRKKVQPEPAKPTDQGAAATDAKPRSGSDSAQTGGQDEQRQPQKALIGRKTDGAAAVGATEAPLKNDQQRAQSASGQPLKPPSTANAKRLPSDVPQNEGPSGTAAANDARTQQQVDAGHGTAPAAGSNGAVARRIEEQVDPGRIDVRGTLRIRTEAAPQIHNSLVRTGNRSDANIDVAVGRPLSESVPLEPLPQEILVDTPELRGYEYVVVDDEVVVVDPQTRNVVEVIGPGRPGFDQPMELTTAEASRVGSIGGQPMANHVQEPVGGGSSQSASKLILSSDQREAIRDGILRLRSNAMLNITTGEQLPDQVPMQPMPQAIASQIPAVQQLDYFVSNERVVLVDPSTHAIVDVIQ